MKQKKASALTFCVTLVLAMIFAFPLYLILSNSFKTYGEIFSSPLGLPKAPTVQNYVNAWNQADFLHYFANTLLSTSVGLLIVVIVSSLAAYKLARTKTKLSHFFFLYFTLSMLLPFEVIMLPLVKILKTLGMLNNLVALGTVQASMSAAFSIFLYHGFVKTIPLALEEAARIDGAGELKTFTAVIFPLLKPITTTVVVLNTLTYWNSFLLPLLTLTKVEVKTLPLFSYSFLGQYSSNYDLQLPAIILSGLPLIIFYLFMQKNIEKGIAASSVKG